MTCDKCGHSAPVEDFKPFRFRDDNGAITVRTICPKCGAISTVVNKQEGA